MTRPVVDRVVKGEAYGLDMPPEELQDGVDVGENFCRRHFLSEPCRVPKLIGGHWVSEKVVLDEDGVL